MLGICVIYLVPDTDTAPLVQISLDQIKANTHSPHRIYGCALRLQDPYRQQLVDGGVALPYMPTFPYPGISEHAHYLDLLVDHAIRDGCTHVATFDMDSWPISAGWDSKYIPLLSKDSPVVAIVRNEVGDNFPYGGFTLMDAAFWDVGSSSFSISMRRKFSPAFITAARPHETGAGILAQLDEQSKDFTKLHRSNGWNPHPLMCGIYGNDFFHLGAASRAPQFITDLNEFSLIPDEPVRHAYRSAINLCRRSFFMTQLQNNYSGFIEALRGTP